MSEWQTENKAPAATLEQPLPRRLAIERDEAILNLLNELGLTVAQLPDKLAALALRIEESENRFHEAFQTEVRIESALARLEQQLTALGELLDAIETCSRARYGSLHNDIALMARSKRGAGRGARGKR